MRHVYLAASAAAALLLSAGAAGAQDWSGPYIGLSLGGAAISDDEGERVEFDTNLDGTYGDTVRTSTMVDAFGPTTANPGGFCDGKANGNNFNSGCQDDDNIGVEFGARAGWDFQSGPWVYGALVEASSVDVEDFVTAFSITPAAYQYNRKMDDVLYAARLRVGRTLGARSLGYVTGGVAMSKVTETFFTTNTANSFTPLTSEEDATGFQLGAGFETRMSDRITLGVEYLYTSLDVEDGMVVRTGPGTAPLTNPFRIVNPAGTDQRRTTDGFDFHGVRLTVSARF